MVSGLRLKLDKELRNYCRGVLTIASFTSQSLNQAL